MNKFIAIIGAVGLLVLSGCTTYASTTAALGNGSRPYVFAFQQEVEPGKFVNCVWAHANTGNGLSCDWLGYNGIAGME